MVYRIYELGITMYPRTISLRIGFGLFLCEKLEMYENALR